MIDSVVRTLQQLVLTLRLADLLDVMVMAAFVYTVLTWFLQARSRVVMSGLITLVVLYFVARLLDMTLTLLVFQVGITVAAVTLVVVFQEEIRRAFERVAFTTPWHAFGEASVEQFNTHILATTVFELAKSRTGALIVLKGRESLDRHLTGGVKLGGVPSEALIYSIFDTSSPGHDGALIIEDGVATRFAAHLPLSQEITGKERFGTRHTAALGLSERSDALLIVVSEERGTVSVAQGGKLDQGLSVAELTERLAAFRQRTGPERHVGLLRSVLTRNTGAKALSLGVAIAAWFVVHRYDSQVIVRTYEVPVVLRDVPEDLFVDPPRPDQARVTLAGSQRDFRDVHPDALVVVLDATNLKPGISRQPITRQAITPPAEIAVQRMEPLEATIVAHATQLVDLPIKPTMSGAVAKGHIVAGVAVTPPTLRVRIAVEDRGKISALKTVPISLDGRARSFAGIENVIVPEGVRLPAGSATTAVVKVTISPR